MGAVNGVDRPLAVMHLTMVVGAEGNSIIDVGFTAKLPRLYMVDIAQGSNDSAPWSPASAIAGKDGASLRTIEKSFGAVLIQHAVVFVPDLPNDFGIAGQDLNILRANGTDIHGFRDETCPWWWTLASLVSGVIADPLLGAFRV